MLNRDELLEAYYLLTNSVQSVWNWELDEELKVLRTDCPYQNEFFKMIPSAMEKEMKKIIEGEEKYPQIFVLHNMLGWICVYQNDSYDGVRLRLKGPFINNVRDERNNTFLLGCFSFTNAEKSLLKQQLNELACLNSNDMFQFAQMLYFAIQGKKAESRKILVHSIHLKERQKVKPVTDQFDKSSNAWKLEQELLSKVKNGDTTISELLGRINLMQGTKKSPKLDSMGKMQQQVNVMLTLVSRAAVEGGMIQKTAFSLCTEYRQKIDNCRSVSELTLLGNEFVLDYTNRVRNAKKYMDCDTSIRLCCEYIDTHLDDKLSLEKLAQKAGYTKYHLSRKFHAEMGCSITEYIQKSKIENAAWKLTYTNESIEQISEELGFSTRTYFTSVFRNHMGMVPTEYRKTHHVV